MAQGRVIPPSPAALSPLPVAAITLAGLRRRLGVLSSVSGQRLAHVDLVARELPFAVPPNVAFVAAVGFDKLAFRHGDLLA